MKEYNGEFVDWDDVLREFANLSWKEKYEGSSNYDIEPKDEPEFVYAIYDMGNYEGSAYVAYYENGKFYLVEGSHCSCYGLEGQWEPEEYTPDTFIKMVRQLNDAGDCVYGLAEHKRELYKLHKEVMNKYG